MTSSIRRPLLYVAAAFIAIATAVPLAVTSGQLQANGIFDECLSDDCMIDSRFASNEQ